MGDKKVIIVKLQTLRRDFETLSMKKGESMQDYMSRVFAIINLIKSYGDKITDVVAKVLRSLTSKFEHVLAAIEESKNISDYMFNELIGSLLAHEYSLNRSYEKVEEKALQAKEESFSCKEKSSNFLGRGRGRGRFCGRGRGRSRGRGQFSESRQPKSDLQCSYCKKSGHTETYCWAKQRDKQKHANLSKKVEDERRGTIAIKIAQGDSKLIYDVQFVPSLAYKLLSVGQLMVNGYSILFDNDSCIVSDKKSGQTVAIVPMTQNNMFPLNVSNIIKNVLVVKSVNETQLWHLRYGYLNINRLKLLTRKNMVVGLPKVGGLELYEGCIFGK
ncbi:uncharacterized protein LOC107868760 [Capsicum annuum]|uniref:uncharacterized protein LOC107868760 n=1 Tax=Capsicum annuum TaxID=4072 RepID=UPI001FB07211|nr:uncharacterized protein LOC107868760 [Capsicum annuum]